MERLRPFFPKSRGKPRVDDRRVLNGNGLQWKDAPWAYGPPKMLYNRFVRWSRMGVFARIFIELVQPGPDGEMIMIDRSRLTAHRTAASLSKGGKPLLRHSFKHNGERRVPPEGPSAG